MKNFDFNSLGVHEMNFQEMQETDGGLILMILAFTAILCATASCSFESNIIVGGSHNTINSSDSLQNGWSADSTNVNLQLKGPMY